MLNPESWTVHRLRGDPEIGDTFEINDRLFTVLDVEMKKGRWGTHPFLTVEARCPECNRVFCFKAYRSKFPAGKKCKKCGGKSLPKSRPRAKPKPPPPTPEPPVLRPPVPIIGTTYHYKGERCVVKKVWPSQMTAEVHFEDNTYDVIGYRKLRQRK